jgi:hypothetical protein
LTSGETVFRSDPDNVKFLVEIVNDHGVPPRDNYLLRSYNNIFDVSAGSDNHISWQLDDPTATAISSEELPIVAPNLADWDSIFGLTITSENLENWNSFFIRAHVTSSNLCEEPPPQLWVVCHKPETQAERTLFVSSEEAVEAHLNHGDVLGECP